MSNAHGRGSGAHSSVITAALVLPATILMPVVVFMRSIRGIRADQSGRGILFRRPWSDDGDA